MFGKSVDKLETDNAGKYIINVKDLYLLNKLSSTNTKEVKNYIQYFIIFF